MAKTGLTMLAAALIAAALAPAAQAAPTPVDSVLYVSEPEFGVSRHI